MNAPISRVLTLVLLCLLLSACGFQLRQPVQLPEHLQKVYVQGGSLELNRELSGILASSATLVESAEEAQAIVQLMAEKQHRRTLSVNQRGKVQEMELHYSVGFKVVQPDGKELLAEERISLQRDYLNDETDVLAKSNEAGQLMIEMQRDAAQRIARRIQSIR